MYDLTGSPTVRYGGDAVQFDPGSAAVYILDSDHRRAATAGSPQISSQFVKLVEMLPQIDAQSTALVCRDVAEEIGDLYRLYIALNYMRKPIITGAFGKNLVGDVGDARALCAAAKRSLPPKPLAVFDICPYTAPVVE